MSKIQVKLLQDDIYSDLQCSLDDWHIIAYRLNYKNRQQQAAYITALRDRCLVYFLIDDSKEKYGVYVGHSAEGIARVLDEHAIESFRWQYAIILCSQLPDGLNASDVRYLERLFYFSIKHKHSYELANLIAAKASVVDDKRRKYLDEIAEKYKCYLQILNHADMLLDDNEILQSDENKASELWYFERRTHTNDLLAKGVAKKVEQGFLLLSGAKLSTTISPSRFKLISKLRALHSEAISADNITARDILFKNANQAACFLAGNVCNAQKDWKNSKGICLAQSDGH